MADEQKTEENQEQEVQVPEKFKNIVEEIEKMTVLDLAELVKILEKKFGVSAQAAVAVAAAPAAGGTAGETKEGGEEKTSFDVVITSAGDKKIEMIKVVRDVTGKGLKEAKDFVDSLAKGEQVLKQGVKKEEAEEIKKKIEAAGGKAELR
ncbi:50S ribosomal protein L7/L12 [bacterium HR34]|nr:50S ribosomal protein L7/L12 [bacterium HR34]